MSIETGMGQMLALIDDMKARIDLTRHAIVGEGTAGQDARDIICVSIMARMTEEKDAAGNQWAPNNEKYKRRKGYRPIGVGSDRKGHRGGSMVNMIEILGRMEISPRELVIHHGVSAQVIRELQWFQNGSVPGVGEGECSGASNQPPRGIAGLDDAILAELGEYLKKMTLTPIKG